MRYQILLTIFLVLSVECFAEFKGVYGEDNRLDITNSSESIQQLSRSVAAKISSKFLEKNGDLLAVVGPRLEDNENLCSGERFGSELSVASCSGFLISNNTLITAGHCVVNQNDCNSSNWVFGFKNDGNSDGIIVANSDRYKCKRVISREFKKGGLDYAVIELDREVVDREPLKLSEGLDISLGNELFVIGHPSGLPAKVAGNAYVRDILKDTFRASLDTFVNNSGSPVFNSDTFEVEGILVSGGTDYASDKSGVCNRVKVCKMTGCIGEGVVKISAALSRLRARFTK